MKTVFSYMQRRNAGVCILGVIIFCAFGFTPVFSSENTEKAVRSLTAVFCGTKISEINENRDENIPGKSLSPAAGTCSGQKKEGVFLSWRCLEEDAPETLFQVWRDGKPLTRTHSVCIFDADGNADSRSSKCSP